MSSSSSSASSGPTSSSSGIGGSPGSSSGAGAGGPSFNPAANAPIVFDATPDSQGTQVYFTAIGENGPGVFSAPADGSMQQMKAALAVGDPLVAPFGIAINEGNKQLFVADPGADAGSDKGAIFALPITGGTPVPIAGSEDMIPRSLEIMLENGNDYIYFTGTDKVTGQPGVFKLLASGGTAMVVLEGYPFNDPSGIAIAKNGDIYVADTIAAASHTASIIKISAGQPSTFVTDLRVGYPTGIALTTSEHQLYVSALSPATLTDAIAIVDLIEQTTSLFTMGINQYREPSGMHRAKGADVFAWVDGTVGPAGGKVLVLK